MGSRRPALVREGCRQWSRRPPPRRGTRPPPPLRVRPSPRRRRLRRAAVPPSRRRPPLPRSPAFRRSPRRNASSPERTFISSSQRGPTMAIVAPGDRQTIALLHRRAGWGLAPGELDAAVEAGVDATVDRLVAPDANGVPAATDPWAGLDITLVPPPGPNATQAERQQARQIERAQTEVAVNAWLDHLVTTPRPLEDWMAWFWHGHFVSGLDKVKTPLLMVQQLRTFRALAFAPIPELVRAATVDPAMLLYLDGATSTGTQPNENYGRELLELFTLGVGNYSEADVQAGAKALTGWTIDRRTGLARFDATRHDGAGQRYLGVDGVHDVDSVVAAVTSQPACAAFVARKLAHAILGPSVDDGVVRDLAAAFAASGLDTRALVRSILDAAATGAAQPSFIEPVRWLVAAQRATSANVP